MATLIPFTANSAKAKNASTTWGALKNGVDVKAAPSRSSVGRDGIFHSGVPSRRTALSQNMQETLTEIGMLLDRNILAEAAIGPAAVTVEFQDIDGNPISTISKPSPVRVQATHEPITPFKGICILVLPVTNPIYKETMLQIREYEPGSGAEHYYFYIPNWSQIEGKAIGIVSIPGVGVGFDVLTISP